MLDILDFSKAIISEAMSEGDAAIDATIGNGHDTLFLAECLGPQGHVYGFDVQCEAIERTRERLQEAGCHDRVTLFHRGHEDMRAVLPPSVAGAVAAVMFNLGYLPGGSDKSLITRPKTTLAALEAACELLRPNGVVSIVIYTGHPDGSSEAEAVEGWARSLDQRKFRAASYRFLNHVNSPPYLIAVEKHAA